MNNSTDKIWCLVRHKSNLNIPTLLSELQCLDKMEVVRLKLTGDYYVDDISELLEWDNEVEEQVAE